MYLLTAHAFLAIFYTLFLYEVFRKPSTRNCLFPSYILYACATPLSGHVNAYRETYQCDYTRQDMTLYICATLQNSSHRKQIEPALLYIGAKGTSGVGTLFGGTF